MDINEIKQVPIVDFLYILGIEPVKHKASGLWYHAPYRNDRNPSLRVSTDKNVWYDYGVARGGDIFNLAGEFINSNEFVAQAKFISETLGGSFPTSFPHYQRIAEKAVKAKGNPFSDIVEKPLSHPALRQYLRERGISADVASRFCCQVEYRIQWQTVFCCRFQKQQRWLRDTQPLLQRLRVAKGHHSHWQEQQRLPSVRGFYGFPLCRNSRYWSW